MDFNLFGLITVLLISNAAANTAPKILNLIWEDNFDTLDTKKWNHLVTAWDGNGGQFQYYRNDRSNSWVENGTLVIRPTLVSDEKTDSQIRYGILYDPNCNKSPCISQSGPDCVTPIHSAYLHTNGHFDVAYSRIEIRAKLPRGDWLLPSIFMLPHEDYYFGWAESGQIDIVRTKGNLFLYNQKNVSVGINTINQTLHWGFLNEEPSRNRTNWMRSISPSDFSDDFHIFEIERTPDHITFFTDGTEVGSIYPPEGGFWELGQYNMSADWNVWSNGEFLAPFDKPFYLIINVAVGGTAFDNTTNSGYPQPWDSESDTPKLEFYEAQSQWLPTWDRPTFQVDYIRVYEL